MKTNPFLAKAKHASALSDVLESIKTPLQKGSKGRGLYVSGLKGFSKLSKSDMSKFVSLVQQYSKVTGLNTEAADLSTFIKYASNVKAGSKFKLESGSLNIKSNITKKSAERYYVMYWADKIISEHNKRIEEAAKLTKKESGTEYATPRLDIHKIKGNGSGYRVVTLEEMANILDKYEENLVLRSKPSTYKLPSNVKKYVADLLSEDKHKLKDYKNTKLLFLDNLIYAMRKANWFSALDIVERELKKGHAAAIYNAYIESGVSIVFEYSEQVSEEITTYEQKYIDALNRLLEG